MSIGEFVIVAYSAFFIGAIWGKRIGRGEHQKAMRHLMQSNETIFSMREAASTSENERVQWGMAKKLCGRIKERLP